MSDNTINNIVTPIQEDVVTSNTITDIRNTIKPKREWKALKKLTDRQILAQELLEKSQIPTAQIARGLGYAPPYLHTLKKKLDKTSLVSAKAKRLAKKAVIETLEMQAVTEKKLDNKGNEVLVEIKPSHANRLTAAAMVLDRSEPIVQKHQTQSVNINLDGTLLDYTNFAGR